MAIRCIRVLHFTDLRECLTYQFRPAGRVTFASRGKSNQNRLPHDTGLRCAQTSLAPVLLRRHAPKGRPVPSALSRRPASKPAAQHLRSASSTGRFCGHRMTRCSPDEIRDNGFQGQTSPDLIGATIQSHARTGSPVRRVSGIGVEGVERHGCRESCDGPGTALRSGPLERRWSERTRNVAKRNGGPDVGCVSSWLLLLAA